MRWLFEAKKRYGLCVLNYMVTSNHIHLLVEDSGGKVIQRSIQLIAGITARDYNRRKGKESFGKIVTMLPLSRLIVISFAV